MYNLSHVKTERTYMTCFGVNTVSDASESFSTVLTLGPLVLDWPAGVTCAGQGDACL